MFFLQKYFPDVLADSGLGEDGEGEVVDGSSDGKKAKHKVQARTRISLKTKGGGRTTYCLKPGAIRGKAEHAHKFSFRKVAENGKECKVGSLGWDNCHHETRKSHTEYYHRFMGREPESNAIWEEEAAALREAERRRARSSRPGVRTSARLAGDMLATSQRGQNDDGSRNVTNELNGDSNKSNGDDDALAPVLPNGVNDAR